MQWVSKREGKRKPFCEVEYAPGGLSFGNEASSTTFYTRAVLLVTVPDASGRDEAAEAALTSERVHASKATMPPPRPKEASGKGASGKGASGATTPAPAGGKRKAAAAAEGEEEGEGEEDEYEVERIVSSRKRGKRTEYLVKWKG